MPNITRPYDIIVSSPAGPWVIAVDNNTFAQQWNYEPLKYPCKSSTGTIIIQLPSIAAYDGQNVRVVITDIDGLAATNNITITPNGSDTINGGASIIISAA